MNIVRAWKDAEYRDSLSDEERATLPPNPAGAIELDDEQLGMVTGGGSNTGRPKPKPEPEPEPTPKRTWRRGYPGLNSRNGKRRW